MWLLLYDLYDRDDEDEIRILAFGVTSRQSGYCSGTIPYDTSDGERTTTSCLWSRATRGGAEESRKMIII